MMNFLPLLAMLPVKALSLMSCIWLIFVSPLAGSGFVSIYSPPLPVPQRQKIESAARSLIAEGKDLAALEVAIACHKPEILESICANIGYHFSDPPLQAAYEALHDWYSIDFLEQAMLHGSDDAGYWAMRKLGHQRMNRPDPKDPDNASSKRLIARGGVVPKDIMTRLIPAYDRLSDAKSARTSKMALESIKNFGLLTDGERAKVLKSLQEEDEAILNKALMRLLDRIRTDPNLTKEIWSILSRAKSDALITTCLRYQWLFELKAWDDAKTRLLEDALGTRKMGPYHNADHSLTNLACSCNPLALEVFARLGDSKNEFVKERVAAYRDIYQRTHPASPP